MLIIQIRIQRDGDIYIYIVEERERYRQGQRDIESDILQV